MRQQGLPRIRRPSLEHAGLRRNDVLTLLASRLNGGAEPASRSFVVLPPTRLMDTRVVPRQVMAMARHTVVVVSPSIVAMIVAMVVAMIFVS